MSGARSRQISPIFAYSVKAVIDEEKVAERVVSQSGEVVRCFSAIAKKIAEVGLDVFGGSHKPHGPIDASA